MYNKILVAVDGSAVSDAALAEAIRLGKDQKATIRLVNVVEENLNVMVPDFPAFFPSSFPLADYEKAIRAAGTRVLDDAKIKVEEAGLTCQTQLIEISTIDERAAHEITTEADKWGAELIVVGTHGRRGLQHLLMGSVAEGVIRTANQPVLLIRS